MSEIKLKVELSLSEETMEFFRTLAGQTAETASTPAPAAKSKGKGKTAPPEETNDDDNTENNDDEVVKDADAVKGLAGEIASESEDAKNKVKGIIKKVGKADSLKDVKEANLEKLYDALVELKESLEL